MVKVIISQLLILIILDRNPFKQKILKIHIYNY